MGLLKNSALYKKTGPVLVAIERPEVASELSGRIDFIDKTMWDNKQAAAERDPGVAAAGAGVAAEPHKNRRGVPNSNQKRSVIKDSYLKSLFPTVDLPEKRCRGFETKTSLSASPRRPSRKTFF